jgi:hypothetical protein
MCLQYKVILVRAISTRGTRTCIPVSVPIIEKIIGIADAVKQMRPKMILNTKQMIVFTVVNQSRFMPQKEAIGTVKFGLEMSIVSIPATNVILNS